MRFTAGNVLRCLRTPGGGCLGRSFVPREELAPVCLWPSTKYQIHVPKYQQILKHLAPHTAPTQELNISKKWLMGQFQRFPKVKFIGSLFLPQNRLRDYSLQDHRLTKSSTLLSAPVLASRLYNRPTCHWKFTDIFSPKWFLRGQCDQCACDCPTKHQIHASKYQLTFLPIRTTWQPPEKFSGTTWGQQCACERRPTEALLSSS